VESEEILGRKQVGRVCEKESAVREEATRGNAGEAQELLKQRVLALIEANRQKLISVAERCGVRPGDTGDFLQDLVVWVLEHPEKPSELRTREAELEGWLVVVARNRAFRTKRAYFTGERRIVSDRFAEKVHESRMLARTVDQLTRLEEQTMLDKAIRALPVQQQAVVDLRLRGFSYAEIARKLDITEGTARSYYFQGVRRLRELLLR
jgi:RNA polymerase sigma factor (sigma-70 family)